MGGRSRKRKKEKQRKRREKKREARKDEDYVLEVYDRLCRSSLEESRKSDDEVLTLRWGALREARIFIIPSAFYIKALRTVGEKAMGALFGIEDYDEYIGLMSEGFDTRKETYELLRDLSRTVETPNPGRWPFPNMWVAPSTPISLVEIGSDWMFHRLAQEDINIKEGVILGWLFQSSAQEIFVDKAVLLEPKEEFAPNIVVWLSVYGTDIGWRSVSDLSPWLYHSIIDFINSHGTYEEHEVSQRLKNNQRKLWEGEQVHLPVPKPYYVVRVQKRIVQKKEPDGEPKRTWVLSYRHDRRGHERVVKTRGPLPLEEKRRKSLEKRGYRIYGPRPPKPYDMKRLERRGILPPRRDEWLAIKVIWLNSEIIGPPEAPYIPSIRKL